MHPSAGGPPVVVDHWCSGLRQRGVDATVLTTNAYAKDSEDSSWVSHYEGRFPIRVVDGMGPAGFGFAWNLKSFLRSRLEESSPEHVDLVHVHNLWSYSNCIAAKLCPRFGVPFVVSTHGMLDPNSLSRKAWKKRWYGKLAEWPSLRRASGLVFTHREEERLARLGADRLPPGHIVPLGSDAPPSEDRSRLAESFYARYPELRGKPLVLFLGRLHSKKGLDLLVEAFASVRKSCGYSHLVLVGPGEPSYVESLARRAHELGIDGFVTFTGPMNGDDKWSALAAASVFVLPSYQENFAISVAEALRMGTPVVLSDRVNIWSDLVAANVAIKTELDSGDVAAKITQVLGADDVKSADGIAMGERGRQYAIEHYNWDRSCEQLLRVYEAVLSK